MILKSGLCKQFNFPFVKKSLCVQREMNTTGFFTLYDHFQFVVLDLNSQIE